MAAPPSTAYADLAADLPHGTEARLFRPEYEPTPHGWKTIGARPIIQMVLDASASPDSIAAEARIVPLGSSDVPDMLALVEAAQPGPFDTHTIELGSYVGIRDAASEHLIAMSGERFQLERHVEVGAIAVHPKTRGQGLEPRCAGRPAGGRRCKSVTVKG